MSQAGSAAHTAEQATTQNPKRVLLVEDDNAVARLGGRGLRTARYDVVRATNGRDASFLVESGAFDALVTDISTPSMGSIELLEVMARVLDEGLRRDRTTRHFEGAQTASGVAALLGLGARFFQGYYVSRPVRDRREGVGPHRGVHTSCHRFAVVVHARRRGALSSNQGGWS